MKTGEIKVIKLVPEEGKHLKNINNGDIYQGVVYLGKFDSASNYTEVTEEEYQVYLLAKQQQAHNS